MKVYRKRKHAKEATKAKKTKFLDTKVKLPSAKSESVQQLKRDINSANKEINKSMTKQAINSANKEINKSMTKQEEPVFFPTNWVVAPRSYHCISGVNVIIKY